MAASINLDASAENETKWMIKRRKKIYICPRKKNFQFLWLEKEIVTMGLSSCINFDLHSYFTDMSKSYRSWTSNSSERSSSVPRVTYRRLEKIASYHYLPRVVYQGSLKKSKSQQSLPKKAPNNFLPMDEFGSLDSLTSVTTFSYIASREQREREEDIYEVKPSTITIRKERTVPKIADLLMNQFNQHHANHGTCIRCHRPKMLGR